MFEQGDNILEVLKSLAVSATKVWEELFISKKQVFVVVRYSFVFLFCRFLLFCCGLFFVCCFAQSLFTVRSMFKLSCLMAKIIQFKYSAVH